MATPETSPEMNGLSGQLGSIKECDSEAIHLSGAVQGRGCLLFFDPTDLRIQSHSENSKEFLQLDQNPIGSKLSYLFDTSLIRQIEEALKSFPWKTQGRHFDYQTRAHLYEAYLFESDGVFGLELEKVHAHKPELWTRTEMVQHVEEFTNEFRNLGNTQQVAQLLCHKIRKITGLDRVMMYQFVQPQWHGEVIAEDRVIEAHSFLGHRFPSSDIPKPARDLYLRNRVRWISNTDEPISPLIPAQNPNTGKKFDLSDSRLRSVSPIHLQYLRNMGVKCSMSFAVTVQEQLWGLVACHHMSDIEVTQEQRLACEIIVNAFAGQGPLLDTLAAQKSHTQFMIQLQKFLQLFLRNPAPIDALFRHHSALMALFESTGVAFVAGDKVDVAGLVPLRNDLKTLGKLLVKKMDEDRSDIFVSTSLAQDVPEIFSAWSSDPELRKMISGVAALRSPAIQDGVFLLFRPEIIRTITWGGDPVKQAKRNFEGPINPRLSFEAWKEVLRHSAKPWRHYEIEGLRTLKEFVFETLPARTS